MSNVFEEIHSEAQPSGNVFDQIHQEDSAPPATEQRGFWRSLADQTNPLPHIKEWLNRPSEIGAAMDALHVTREAAMRNPANHGKPPSQWVHSKESELTPEERAIAERGFNAHLPAAEGNILGEVSNAAQEAAHQVQAGNIKGAVGTLVGGYGVPAAMAATGAAFPKVTKTLESAATPEQAESIALAERRGIPLTADVATQNKFLQGTKSLLSRQPITARQISQAANDTEAAMAKTGAQLAEEASSPTAARTKLTAGTNAVDRLRGRVEDLRMKQNEAGDNLRSIANRPENIKEIQTGTKTSDVLGPDGKPVETPVTDKIAGPTDYSAVKSAVKPILDRLEKNIPEAQKQNSPGLSVLRQIMNRPDSVSLDTALGDLSAINSIGYNDIPALRDVSQGVASYAGKALRSSVNQAASALGPEGAKALNDLRSLTGQKKSVAMMLKSQINSNPVSFVNRLISNEDAGVNLLQTVAKETPESIPDIARSTLERILDNATAKGGFKNVDSTARMWDKIGPETKKLLFGEEKAKELDNFFRLGRMVGENPNPSGTASVSGIAATGAALVHNPIAALASIVTSKKIANLLTSANGVERVNRALTLDLKTPTGKAAALKLLSGPSSEEGTAPAALQPQE